MPMLDIIAKEPYAMDGTLSCQGAELLASCNFQLLFVLKKKNIIGICSSKSNNEQVTQIVSLSNK